MLIIQRYLIKEVLTVSLATLLVLLIIISGSTLVRLLSSISEGSIPADILLKLLFVGTLSSTIQLIPIALLIGSMMGFGKLYKDSEMTAMHAAGIGPKIILQGMGYMIAAVTVLMFVLIMFASPALNHTNESIQNEANKRPEASGLAAGEFLQFGMKDRQLTLFIQQYSSDGERMESMFIHQRTPNVVQTVTAKSGQLFANHSNGDRLLKLYDGQQTTQNTKGVTVTKFAQQMLRIPANQVSQRMRLSEMDTATLLKKHSLASQAEWHWRLALVISAPLMILLAYALSYTTPRKGMFSKIILGIVAYAIYANLIISGKAMIETAKIPAIIGLWWVHLLFFMLAIFLLHRQYGAKKS